MSARGEGAGQPSTSAQGQPAAPAPQKRGRGRPRKQQQVSTRRGGSPRPPSCRSPPGPRDAQPLGHQSAVATTATRCPPAGGRAAVPGARRSGEVGSRVWVKRVPGLSLLCTARSVAVAPGDWKRPGSDLPGLADASLSAFRWPRGKEVRGLGCAGGAESWGPFVRSFPPHPPPSRAASGPGSATPQPPLWRLPRVLGGGRRLAPSRQRTRGPPGPLRAL